MGLDRDRFVDEVLHLREGCAHPKSFDREDALRAMERRVPRRKVFVGPMAQAWPSVRPSLPRRTPWEASGIIGSVGHGVVSPERKWGLTRN